MNNLRTENVEVRVGIEPTNKGFADLYPPFTERHTVHKKTNSALKIAGFLPGGPREGSSL